MAESCNSSELPFDGERLPSIADEEQFYSCLSHLLSSGCRPEKPSIYLLGSRAGKTAVATSDVDLAIIFGKSIDVVTRTKTAQLAAVLQKATPVLLDFVILDEQELKQGLTPNLIQTRLLAGPELLCVHPRRSLQGTILYYIGLAMVFSHLIRAATSRGLALPLTVPDPADPYLGYTRNGIRIGRHEYRPGLNLLLKLVVAIASFRLAFIKGIITINRQEVVSQYGSALASDPWWPMIRDLYELARGKFAGELPSAAADRAKLTACCSQVASFENTFIEDAMSHLPAWLPWADAVFAAQVEYWIAGTHSPVPAHQQKLEAIKSALKSLKASPPGAS